MGGADRYCQSSHERVARCEHFWSDQCKVRISWLYIAKRIQVILSEHITFLLYLHNTRGLVLGAVSNPIFASIIVYKLFFIICC